MRCQGRLIWTLLAGLTVISPRVAAGKLRVVATLTELPRAPTCTGRTIRVLCRYRTERLVHGVDAGRTLWVMHRCPELSRGPRNIGRGTAPPLKPGHRHLLELAPYSGNIDASPDDAETVRYEALETDPAPPPTPVAVVVTGPSGAKLRLDFEADTISVGRAADSDVLLNHRAVALRQFVLEVRDEDIVVVDLQPGRTRLNGAPLRGERALTHKDTLSVGPFALNVSRFTPKEAADE